jgi:hypothetical protein
MGMTGSTTNGTRCVCGHFWADHGTTTACFICRCESEPVAAAGVTLAATPAPLDVEHADCGDRCACYLRGWTVVNDEWDAVR